MESQATLLRYLYSNPMQILPLQQMFSDNALHRPNDIAIRTRYNKTLSFRELQNQIDYTCQFLNQRSINRLAIVLRQGPEMAVSCMATMTSHCAVPLNPANTPAELAAYIQETHPDGILVDSETKSQLAKVAEELDIPLLLLKPSPLANGSYAIEDFPLQNPSHPCAETSASQDSMTALVLLTSGSTSLPKVVSLTQKNLVTSARNLARSLSLSEKDCCLNMLPLFHVGALVDLLLGPLSVGGSSLVSDEISAEVFFEQSKSNSISWFQAVPALLKNILEIAKTNSSKIEYHDLRFIRSVSAPLSLQLLHGLEDYFDIPVIEIYGMTETSGLITSNPLPPGERRAGSVGISFGPEIRIIDEFGNPAEHGVKGEVVVRGDTVISAYENNSEANISSFAGDWLKTGDQGFLSEDGYLTITGRIKELINRGGEKIAPREIDEIAVLFSGVKEAASFPIRHVSLGEDVGIAVVCDDHDKFDESLFLKHCALFLSRFKIPRKVFLLPELPKGGSGKLQRHKLQSLLGDSEKQGKVHQKPPSTRVEKVVSELVNSTLDLNSDNLAEDFFELGGDSLTAVSFIEELERKLGTKIGVSALYDYPMLSEFSDFVDKELLGLSTSKKDFLRKPGYEFLTKGMMQELAKQALAFKGSRLSPDSLLAGVNTLGSSSPLFWCTNGGGEFNRFASALNSNQAIYGMRTLWNIRGRTDAATRELAKVYLGEVLKIQPSGPYFVGGFCEGGKVAKELCRLLENLNHEIGLLILQESMLSEPYSGRLALFYCPDSPFSAYTKFAKPELGWLKLYSGQVSIYKTPWSHHQSQNPNNIKAFAGLVESELQGSAKTTMLSDFSRHGDKLQEFADDDYRASVKLVGRPWLPIPGKAYNVKVTVKNLSDIVWKPTKLSGVLIGVRWVTLFGHYHGEVSSYKEITEEIAPGETLTVTITAHTPFVRKPWQLDIDLVEDGVRWFNSADEKQFRSKVFVLSRENNWHRVAQQFYRKYYLDN